MPTPPDTLRTPAPPAAQPDASLHAKHGTEIGHAEAQAVDGTGDPLLPHDRDEAVGITGGAPSRPMQQAHRDLQRGLRDTDRGEVVDRVYRGLKDGPDAGQQGRPDEMSVQREPPAAREGEPHGRRQRER